MIEVPRNDILHVVPGQNAIAVQNQIGRLSQRGTSQQVRLHGGFTGDAARCDGTVLTDHRRGHGKGDLNDVIGRLADNLMNLLLHIKLCIARSGLGFAELLTVVIDARHDAVVIRPVDGIPGCGCGAAGLPVGIRDNAQFLRMRTAHGDCSAEQQAQEDQ